MSPISMQPPNDPLRQQAVRRLWQLQAHDAAPADDNLFAVIDAARDMRIYPELARWASTHEIACLYRGEAARDFATVAPYLVRLKRDLRLFEWLWAEGWGKGWCVFARASTTFPILMEHFRRITTVRLPDGAKVLFRFYDPGVLSTFLPTCDPHQASFLFGPVIAYYTEAGALGITQFRPPFATPSVRSALLAWDRA